MAIRTSDFGNQCLNQSSILLPLNFLYKFKGKREESGEEKGEEEERKIGRGDKTRREK